MLIACKGQGHTFVVTVFEISLCLVASPPAPVSPLGSPPKFELFLRGLMRAASPLLSTRMVFVDVEIGGNASPF